MAKLNKEQKIQLVADTYVSIIETYCKSNKINIRQMCEKLLNRPNAVRVAKLANFSISGTTVASIFNSDEDLYTITNKAYGLIRSKTEVDINSVDDPELLKQLQE